MPLVKVPKLVTVLPNFKLPPVPVNCTVPPVASNAPFASKIPPLSKSNTPSMSENAETVIVLFSKFNSFPELIIKLSATFTSPWSVLAVPPPLILRV